MKVKPEKTSKEGWLGFELEEQRQWLSEEDRNVAIGERDPRGKWERGRWEVLGLQLLLHKWKEGEAEGPNKQSAIFPRLAFPSPPHPLKFFGRSFPPTSPPPLTRFFQISYNKLIKFKTRQTNMKHVMEQNPTSPLAFSFYF